MLTLASHLIESNEGQLHFFCTDIWKAASAWLSKFFSILTYWVIRNGSVRRQFVTFVPTGAIRILVVWDWPSVMVLSLQLVRLIFRIISTDCPLFPLGLRSFLERYLPYFISEAVKWKGWELFSTQRTLLSFRQFWTTFFNRAHILFFFCVIVRWVLLHSETFLRWTFVMSVIRMHCRAATLQGNIRDDTCSRSLLQVSFFLFQHHRGRLE